MRMDYVQFARPFRDRFEQERASGVGIDALSSKTQCARQHRMELAFGSSIATCEQGNVMSKLDQLVPNQATTLCRHRASEKRFQPEEQAGLFA